MKEKLNDILKTSDDHISENILFGYVRQQLSATEVRKVEEHLADCELCSDALEGMMQSADLSKAHTQLSSVKKSIHKKYQGNEVRNMFPFTRSLAIAATILLLAVSAWFIEFQLEKDSQKIFTDQFEPYPVPPAVNENQSASPVVSESENKIEDEKQYPVSPIKKIDANKTLADKKEDLSNDEEVQSAPTVASESMPQADDYTAKNNGDNEKKKQTATKYSDSTFEFSAASNSQNKSETESLKNANADVSLDEVVVSGLAKISNADQQNEVYLNRGMEFYQDGKYVEAIAEFEMVLKNEPDNSTANFYSGVSALAMNNVDEALRYFKKTDSKNNQYY
ncbi:MAG: hypothetical protein LH473_00300, partial [Chitinophagales bacterium]|nr:hypothetical protein [Chitinophagales bacterium]